MATVNSTGYRCKTGDTLCEIAVYEQEVIVVPVVLLAIFFVILVALLLLHFCPEKVKPHTATNGLQSQRSKRTLHGIEAPRGLDPLEHETIALDGPSYSTFTTPNHVSPAPIPALPELPRQRLPESFNRVSALPLTFSMKADDSVSLYRAKMDNRNVVLRVLKDSANARERQSFLAFASFLSQLGPHPFLLSVLGIVSLNAPLVTVVEEMGNRDLLGFLWRCREDHVGQEVPCDMTEKRIFTMAAQVASALDYLHKKNVLHGNICARSVLVSEQLTAKLWGLGSAFRKSQGLTPHEDSGMKKWQAPEVLARKSPTAGSDVWSFGALLYEMVTLGDVPFANVSVTELLQFLQRGKTLKRPANCSNSLYSIIKNCCQWKEHDRATLPEVIRKLQSGQNTANDSVVLRVSEPINVERYLHEAGYGESIHYSIL
ncbi:tyrosine-protein kinase STYK1b [Scleropages formosus]|uniref:tyrosine-protein kinase STYK1b n=1 Tax=Scleropages formosus TaxID=113540 RepID=UPI0008791DD1|nr:tyrosine-protein kinase STYK1-like [Scleropages formosus]XP_018591476.1 tyrosine-protein kinase STYK1-like [Scleropages formosus]